MKPPPAWRAPLAALLLLLVGAAPLLWPMLASAGDSIPGGADARLNHYLLEHHWLWLRGEPTHSDYWTLPIFHPTRDTLAYSDVRAPSAVLYVALRALGLAPSGAYVLWIALVVTATAGAVCWAVRRGFGLDPVPVAVVAVVCVFGASRLRHVSQSQMLTHGLSLLAIALLVLSFVARSPRRRAAAVLAASVAAALQFWSSFYLGWFLAVGALIYLLAALVFTSTRRALVRWLADQWLAILAGTLAAAALLVPLAWRYLGVLSEVGSRAWADAEDGRLGLSDWIHPGGPSLFYGGITLPFSNGEPHGFGFVTLLVAACGFVLLWRQGSWGRPLVVASIVLAVIGTDWPGSFFEPWRWVYAHVPGAEAIRLVWRVGVFLAPAVGLAIGLALHQLRRPFLAFLLGAFVVLEQSVTVPSYAKPEFARREARIANAIDPHCTSFLAIAPDGLGKAEGYRNALQLDAMWAQVERGIPTINGYSGNVPPGWLGMRQNAGGSLTPETVAGIRSSFDRWVAHHGLPVETTCLVEVTSPNRQQQRLRPTP